MAKSEYSCQILPADAGSLTFVIYKDNKRVLSHPYKPPAGATPEEVRDVLLEWAADNLRFISGYNEYKYRGILNKRYVIEEVK